MRFNISDDTYVCYCQGDHELSDRTIAEKFEEVAGEDLQREKVELAFSVEESIAFFKDINTVHQAHRKQRQDQTAPKTHFSLQLAAEDGGAAVGSMQPPTPLADWHPCRRRTTDVGESPITLTVEVRFKLNPKFTDTTKSIVLWYNTAHAGDRYFVKVPADTKEISMSVLRAYARSLDKLRIKHQQPPIVLKWIDVVLVTGRPSNLGLHFAKGKDATSPPDCPSAGAAYSDDWSNTFFKEYAIDHMMQLSHAYKHLEVILRSRITKSQMSFVETFPLVVQSLSALYVVSNSHKLLNGTHRTINDLRCSINANIWYRQTSIEEQTKSVRPEWTAWGVKIRTNLLLNVAVRQATAAALAYSAVTGEDLLEKSAEAGYLDKDVADEMIIGCRHLLTMYTAPSQP